MKIAQVSPLYESVPPKLYGGTERVVHYLTEELVRMGHDVTLFASGDSRTSAHLVPVCSRSLRLNTASLDGVCHHLVMAEEIFRQSARFDIVHSHIDYLIFPLARRMSVPVLTTLHGRLDIPDLVPVFGEYRDMPLVSISDAQRGPLSEAGWRRTVHHGLPLDLYGLGEGKGGYLAFVGRISPEKRVDSAIALAKRTGIPLKIAAKVSDTDRSYHEREIKPLLDHPLVEFLGEIGDAEKGKFLGDAGALIFSVDWPEPFGLAMIEAMACGTPVIGRKCGSIPEIIDHGVTGFVFETDDEAAASIGKALALDRREIRKTFERRFSASRMAAEYVALYEELMEDPALGGRRMAA